MGYQKVGAFALMKAHGILEQQLKPLGYSVTWQEFSGGPQLLEGLKGGAVDFAHSGEAPPIFAQAASIHRIRARRAEVRGDPGAKGQSDQDGRRSQGQEDRTEQGLKRALPTRASA